jgi:hypothetical protein
MATGVIRFIGKPPIYECYWYWYWVFRPTQCVWWVFVVLVPHSCCTFACHLASWAVVVVVDEHAPNHALYW